MSLSFQPITSKNNPRIVRVAKYMDKKYREQDGIFVCEGIKLFEEAVLAGVRIREIYIDETVVQQLTEKLENLLSVCYNTDIFVVPGELYRKISTENAPQGILAVVEKLSTVRRVTGTNTYQDETIMLFESVRDPGNLGTLIRTAAAFGLDRLLLSSDCADIYNPKTIRAAMGAIFKIQIDYYEDLICEIEALSDSGRRTLAALPRERALVAGKDTLNASDCIVIGNEGHGLSDYAVGACDDAVYIPMQQNTESLNAAIASSVLMWEISKKRLSKS